MSKHASRQKKRLILYSLSISISWIRIGFLLMFVARNQYLPKLKLFRMFSAPIYFVISFFAAYKYFGTAINFLVFSQAHTGLFCIFYSVGRNLRKKIKINKLLTKLRLHTIHANIVQNQKLCSNCSRLMRMTTRALNNNYYFHFYSNCWLNNSITFIKYALAIQQSIIIYSLCRI